MSRRAITVKMTGEKEMKKNLEGYAREMPKAARKGTKEWATEKLTIAVNRAPEKTGKLKASGKIRTSIRKKEGKENIAASLVFGGPDVLYARRVHETHKTNSKFLERTIHEAAPTAAAELAAKIQLKSLGKA